MTKKHDNSSGETAKKLLGVYHLKEIVGIDTAIVMFDDAMKNYVQHRDVNMYQQMIETFFTRSYYLGKTPLSINNHFQMSARLLDIILKHEESSSTKVVADHSKYLMAFLNEFLEVIKIKTEREKHIIKKSILEEQLEVLKKVLNKMPSSSNTLSIVEGLLFSLSESPLLLENRVQSPVKAEAVLPSSMSKLTTKQAVKEALKRLYSYDEDTFYKLVSHTYNKYNTDLFHEEGYSSLPVYVSALMGQLKKGELNMGGLLSYFQKKTIEKVAEFNFYPLSEANMLGLYKQFTKVLGNLKCKNMLLEEEEVYFKITFLKSVIHLDQEFAQIYINEVGPIVKSMYEELSTLNTESLQKTLDTDAKYTLLHELLLENGDSRKGEARYVNWQIIKGENVLKRGNPLQEEPETKNTLFSNVTSNQLIHRTEFDVITNMYNKLLIPLKEASHLIKDNKNSELLFFLKTFENQLCTLKLDAPNYYPLLKGLFYKEPEFDAGLGIFVTRMNCNLLTSIELQILANQRENWGELPFNKIPDDQRDNVLRLLIDKDYIRPTNEMELNYLFKADATPALVYEVAAKYYEHQNEIEYISNTMMNHSSFSQQEKEETRNRLLHAYLQGKVYDRIQNKKEMA